MRARRPPNPPARLVAARKPDGPELVLEAFTQVPRLFWIALTAKSLHNLMRECDGRLTLPEREYLWQLLGHTDEPPRRMRVVFDHARMLRLSLQGVDELRLLDALRGGHVA